MADTTISPNMGLPVPNVGVAPGPDWAQDTNSCWSITDGHNHTPGSGVQVPTAGLNINSDLPLNQTNLTTVRSVRFFPQASPLALPADLGCVYESGVDLYYNDGNGNQIRMTQGGSVAGASGTITGLVAPASASYNSGLATFIFQSDVNTAANLDVGSVILRDLTVSSFGLTLAPPTLSSDYTITLPTLPASTGYLTIDPSGNISADGAMNIVTSANSGIWTNTLTGTPEDVTNLSVTITTNGRPVALCIQTSAAGFMGINSGVLDNFNQDNYTRITRDGTNIATMLTSIFTTGGSEMYLLPFAIPYFVDQPSAGSHTYVVQYKTDSAPGGASWTAAVLVAYQL